MSGGTRIGRRDFMHASAEAIGAGLLLPGMSQDARADVGAAVRDAAAKVGFLPQRELGTSGRRVSVLAGTAEWTAEVVEAAILCGINYWHRANRWSMAVGAYAPTPPSILKNREAHHCEVLIDRVRGNHETGRFDETEHYQFVKNAIDESGLRYFDDFKLHFGYHSVAEYEKERAAIRAFERLKREGLVKHLSLSQHSYKGNPRVPGGEGAVEVLTAIIEDGVFEHGQLFYSYGDGPEVDRLLELARRKGFGTIAMKTMRGVGRLRNDPEFMKQVPPETSPHHAVARWLSVAGKADAAVIAIKDLDQFVDTYSGAGKPLRASDGRLLQRIAQRANAEACRLCNECMPHCSKRLPIGDILRFERYALDYGEMREARRLYAGLDLRGDSCHACFDCAARCPMGLRIPQRLASAHSILG